MGIIYFGLFMDTESFKRMCRLLDYIRRSYISREWDSICAGKSIAKLSARHVYYLMLIRFQLPCNLNTIMQITGLSSSAASTFVEKMVQSKVFLRVLDPEDRRNVRILASEEITEIFREMDRRLDTLIDHLTSDCTEEELHALDLAGKLVYRKIQINKEWLDAQINRGDIK